MNVRHIVEYHERWRNLWTRYDYYQSNRGAVEARDKLRDEMRRTGDPDPQVRIRMGDPEELMRTMNEVTK